MKGIDTMIKDCNRLMTMAQEVSPSPYNEKKKEKEEDLKQY